MVTILDRECVIHNEAEAQALHEKTWECEKSLIQMLPPKNRKDGKHLLLQLCRAYSGLEAYDLQDPTYRERMLPALQETA